MSIKSANVSVLAHFSALADPQQQWRVMYPLREVLLLVLGATLCGIDDFVEVRLWGKPLVDANDRKAIGALLRP